MRISVFLVCALVGIGSAPWAVQASNECASPAEALTETPADLDAALRSHAEELKGRVGPVCAWKGATPGGDALFMARYSVLGADGKGGNNWDVHLAAYRMTGETPERLVLSERAHPYKPIPNEVPGFGPNCMTAAMEVYAETDARCSPSRKRTQMFRFDDR